MKKKKFRQSQAAKNRLNTKLVVKTALGAGILSIIIFYFVTAVQFFNPEISVAATAGDYQTTGTGNWNVAGTWQKFNGTSWLAAASPPTNANGVITIRSGHTVTVTANVTVDQVVVASGGTVVVNSGVTVSINNDLLTPNDFDVTGIVKNAGSISIGPLATLVFENGGKYQHNYTTSTGTIPSATWSTGSTCEIIGYTSNANPPSNLQTFYNFTWNCALQTAAVQMKLDSWSINGTLTVASTGTSQLIFNDNDFTLTAGDDYIQSGGTFILSNTNGRTGTFNIGGDYNQTGGTFSVVTGTGSVGTLKVSGNWTHTGGTLKVGGDATTNAQIIFRKAGSQIVTTGGNTVSGNVDFTVNSSATLVMGTSILTGRKFTLSASAGLTLGDAGGISTSGSTGNIQTTGGRSFSTTASYTYNGSISQITGSGLPATVQNLTLNNNSDLTLTSTVSVSSVVTLTSGKIVTGSNELRTLSTAAAAIIYTSSSYVIGNLKRSVSGSGSYDFPVGTSSSYELANVTLSSAIGVANILGYFTNANPIVDSLRLRKIFIDKYTVYKMLDYGYWTLTPNATMMGGSYKVTLKETGQSNRANYPNLYCVLKRSSPTVRWQSVGTHDSNTQTESGGTVTAVRSGLNSFSDFGIGYTAGFMIFINDSLISGTAGTVNATYLFGDVVQGVDARVKILTLKDGATLDSIDNTVEGYYEAWQPFINPTPNDTSSVKFSITFKKSGTTTDTVLSGFSMMAVDVDGNNSSIKEQVEASTYNRYRTGTGCNLTITNPGAGAIRALSAYLQFDDIDTNNVPAMFEIDKSNASTINYTTTIISTSTSTDARQFCIFFKPFNFTINSPLPVFLTDFTAKSKDNEVNIIWSTAAESNNDYFTLERSQDGKEFSELAKIKGSGSTSTLHRYSYTDDSPLRGTSYYQLTQTDYNGRSKTFTPVSVSTASNQIAATEFHVFPNPFKDFFNVQFHAEEDADVELQLLNYSGAKLFSSTHHITSGNNSIYFSPSVNTVQGLYILRITKDNEMLADLKVLCKK